MMSRVIVARENETAVKEEKVMIKGSTSPLPEAEKEGKVASLKRWRSFTRIFDSSTKNKSRPRLRQASSATDVSPEYYYLPVILSDPGIG